MTGGAVDFALNRLTRAHSRGIHVRVTLAARDLCMTGPGNFHGPYEHGASIFGLQLFVAMAAHAVGVSHALRVEDFSNFVRLMAIWARWKHMSLLLPKFAPDGFAVNDLDLGVTLSAGGRDILARDRRLGIRMRQYGMRRMT